MKKNMLKMITVSLLATVFVTGTMRGQSLSASSPENRINLREAVAKETEKLKSESAAIDPKKMEKMQRQAPQKKWSGRDKVILTAIVVALVGLAVVLAYNSKRCIKRSPPGCSFTEDIDCECVEYAK